MSATPLAGSQADPHAALRTILDALDRRADHFAVLQLGRDAGPDRVRDTYFRLAKVVHPDLPAFLNDPKARADATRAFQAITTAHAVLSDPAKREAYVQGMEALKQAQLLDAMTAPVPASSSPSGRQPVVITQEAARIYLARGKNALVRRDYVVAQDALTLACRALTGADLHDAQIGLGWAIFNNAANPEAERLAKPRELWLQVVAEAPKVQSSAQAHYYLALWNKQHGEVRELAKHLEACLALDARHIEAQREKMLLERRRGPSVVAQAAKIDGKTTPGRLQPASSPSQSHKIALEKKPSLLERLFGAKKS